MTSKSPTGKPKRQRTKREPIDPATLPPAAIFDPWWTDPRCVALCERIAHAIMRGAPQVGWSEKIEVADE